MRILVFLMLALIASPAYSQITIGRYRVNGSIEFNADLQIEEVVPMTTIPDPIAGWNLSDTSAALGGIDLDNVNSVAFATGKIGDAASFTRASTQRLKVDPGNLGAINVGGSLTLQCWIKPATFNNSLNGVIGISTAYRLYINDTVFSSPFIRAAATDASGEKTATSTTALSAGSWYHVVCRVDEDADELTVWVNGTKEATTAFTGTVQTPSVEFAIGSVSGGASYYEGLIDLAYIWDTALSDAQIAALYNGGDGLELPIPIDPVPEATLHSAVAVPCEQRLAVAQSNVLRKTVTVPHPQ